MSSGPVASESLSWAGLWPWGWAGQTPLPVPEPVGSGVDRRGSQQRGPERPGSSCLSPQWLSPELWPLVPASFSVVSFFSFSALTDLPRGTPSKKAEQSGGALRGLSPNSLVPS